MSSNSAQPFKFAVIHLGARLHYAVPAVLEQAGMLQTLYTDAHAQSGSLFPLRALPSTFQPRGLRRLFSRRIPPSIPSAKVRSWSRPSLQIEWLNRRQPERRKEARYWHERQIGGHWLARRAIAENFGGANALYVHPCVSTDAVREAKRRGMFIVLEAISHPLNKLVERREYERYGTVPPEPESELRDNIAFFKEEALMADVVLAASTYVRDGLIEIGIDPARVAVVPYGLNSDFFQEAPVPQPGRVLFVGNISYLKGVPYLAEAARQLKADGFSGEIRAIGPHSDLINRPEFAGLTYGGQVPRAEVKREFLTADIFVFPTLSDGFGIVLLEAMAAGLPVVCTPNCAALLGDNDSGLIVPTHDSKALKAGILKITADRSLRDQMGKKARLNATRHTLKEYGDILADVITRHASYV